MRNKRFLIVVGAALIFGLLAAFSVSRYLESAQAYQKDLNNVMVAKVDIPVGTMIIAEQLTAVKFPGGATPNGVFNSNEKLIGRVAVVNIAAREPITDNKLATEGAAGGLSAIIPEGYRAMTVRVDEVLGVSGFIQPNSLVDIVVVIEPPANNKAAGQGRISKIVLQNIKVLASGQNINQPKADSQAAVVGAVTLQVTPEQAEKLALATSEGRLQLVMRNSIDQGDEQTPGANKSTLLTGERAMLVPDPGMSNSEQQPRVAAAPAQRRPRVRVEQMSYPRESTSSGAVAATPVPVSQTRRPAVEMYQGTKKSSVEFP